MKNKLFKNGFIIKSYEEKPYEERNIEKVHNKYFGIGRYITWPLYGLSDDISIRLNNEAMERWFGYQDNRLWVVPDLDFLLRYEYHCSNLKIPTFCLQIESSNSIITSTVNLFDEKMLGYDYADVDMETSCLYDDLNTEDSYIKDSFRFLIKKLNRYGLVDSLDVIQQYLSVRDTLIKQGYDMEEYYCPTIVKISKVNLKKN